MSRQLLTFVNVKATSKWQFSLFTCIEKSLYAGIAEALEDIKTAIYIEYSGRCEGLYPVPFTTNNFHRGISKTTPI